MDQRFGTKVRAPLFFVAATLLASPLALPRAAAAATLDDGSRRDVLQTLAREVRDNYIFPETAEKLAALLERKSGEGEFDAYRDADQFADALSKLMREETNDLHFAVSYDESFPDAAPDPAEKDEEGGAPRAVNPKWAEQQRRRNFGFEKVEILEGNVGYLDLRMFAAPELAAETAVAAMNFLANTDALIIDLRSNGGGMPEMIQLILSYLCEGDPIHFNTFYNRPEDARHQFWTLPYVPGKRMGDTDVYVLTSGLTGSAAEEFAYDIKTLERGTLVGRTTAGAAHPGGRFPLGHHMAAFIATGRAINPVTGTDWEGVGVEPDVDVPEGEALARAHRMALEGLLEKGDDPAFRAEIEWELSALATADRAVELSEESMARLAGEYGPRTVRRSGDGLVYQRAGEPAFPLIPISEDQFWIGPGSDAKVEFHVADNGSVAGFTLLFKDGRRMEQARTD